MGRYGEGFLKGNWIVAWLFLEVLLGCGSGGVVRWCWISSESDGRGPRLRERRRVRGLGSGGKFSSDSSGMVGRVFGGNGPGLGRCCGAMVVVDLMRLWTECNVSGLSLEP